MVIALQQCVNKSPIRYSTRWVHRAHDGLQGSGINLQMTHALQQPPTLSGPWTQPCDSLLAKTVRTQLQDY